MTGTKGLTSRLLMALAIMALAILPLSADGETGGNGIGTLHMQSSVARAAGVDVPEGATLVGNLLIEYSYNGSDWEYVSEASVPIPDLGQAEDNIYLRASYYGNEPSDYDCSVKFATGGWNRTSGRSLYTSSRSISGGTVFNNEDSDLPISFDNLSVVFSDSEHSSSRGSTNTNITVLPGDSHDSFTLHVPVQDPINGRLVATLQAAWPAKELASGDYTADIQVEVSANT